MLVGFQFFKLPLADGFFQLGDLRVGFAVGVVKHRVQAVDGPVHELGDLDRAWVR